MVLPRLVRFLRVAITKYAEWESSPVVGSSKKIKLGLDNSWIPILRRRFSPPERPPLLPWSPPPTSVSEQSLRPNSMMTSSTSLSILWCLDSYVEGLEVPSASSYLNCAAYLKVSRVVRYGDKISSWTTYADLMLDI
ncbi:hypothetical protein WICPIJ_003927 [Wickerhamomyces pijperi]|uniref:Uncharacterized protein n=1 Tax=Wickerhamomyces pijperi TaxID=599730 RepID=A0A9P8Q8R0_WICPI|nr:hypothetical protein WICPIJ_003927 [Wickerhamomyces pijperi]